MATMIIHDDALWARHIEGDPALAQRIRSLSADDAIVLRIDGRPIRFRKTRNERAADMMKPDPDFAEVWRGLQARRGASVTVEPEPAPVDPYLLSLTATLTEWNSPDDAAAYDGL